MSQVLNKTFLFRHGSSKLLSKCMKLSHSSVVEQALINYESLRFKVQPLFEYK
jgi:hypothetical protein